MAIILTNEQRSMLLRLMTNYQTLLTDSTPLTEHQINFVNFITTLIPMVQQPSIPDRQLIMLLQAQIRNHYQPMGS